MQLFQLNEQRYLICLKKRYSWEHFKKLIKVSPGSYSEEFAKGLYSSVFYYSNNLGKEYRKFYQNEYENIYRFMFWRYGVSEEICAQLPSAASDFLAVFKAGWQMEDDDLLKDTFIAIFSELDK